MDAKPEFIQDSAINTQSSAENSLPPIKEETLYAELVKPQLELYKAYLLHDIQTDSKSFYLNKLMQFRKIANHPGLLQEDNENKLQDLETELILNSGKMIVLDRLLSHLEQEKHKVLIFCQMTRMLDFLEDYCEFKQYKCCRIDGNTEQEARVKQTHEFAKPDSDKFIFLLSTRAGGLGLNLSAADTVILYDSDINPLMDRMAIERAYTTGQKNPVSVYRLVTKNTVEEKIVEFQTKKEEMTIDMLKKMMEFGSDVILNGGSNQKED